MKNCYLSKRQVIFPNDFFSLETLEINADHESTELYENLNPVLSDGHRANIISKLLDKNVPREVADVITQLVVSVPHDSGNKGYTDEQIEAAIVSRHYQNEIELDVVRRDLDSLSEELFPDSAPAEPAPAPAEPAPAPAEPAPGTPSPA